MNGKWTRGDTTIILAKKEERTISKEEVAEAYAAVRGATEVVVSVDFMTAIRALRDGTAKHIRPERLRGTTDVYRLSTNPLSYGTLEYVRLGQTDSGVPIFFSTTVRLYPTDFTKDWEIVQ